MSGLLETMFEGLVIYVWNNPLNDDDCGAIIFRSEDFSEVQEIIGEYPSDKPPAKSFGAFERALDDAEIPYDDVSDNMEYHIHVE
jgi:hypothetical protein